MAPVNLEVLANQYVENITALVRAHTRVPAPYQPSHELAAEKLRRDIWRELLAALAAVESAARDAVRGLPVYPIVMDEQEDAGGSRLVFVEQRAVLRVLGEPDVALPEAVHS